MDAALGALILGGLALLGIVALVQSASAPSGRAQPGTRAGRPSYSASRVPEMPAFLDASAPFRSRESLPGSAEVEQLLLNIFNDRVAEAASRPDAPQLSNEQMDDFVIERSLEAVMNQFGVTRREAAEVILGVFESGWGRQGSPKARLQAIVANG